MASKNTYIILYITTCIITLTLKLLTASTKRSFYGDRRKLLCDANFKHREVSVALAEDDDFRESSTRKSYAQI